jgi:hypothetical protein
LGKDQIHEIKDSINAGAKDYVGVAPNGDIITSDGEGKAQNQGPADWHTNKKTGLCP